MEEANTSAEIHKAWDSHGSSRGLFTVVPSHKAAQGNQLGWRGFLYLFEKSHTAPVQTKADILDFGVWRRKGTSFSAVNLCFGHSFQEILAVCLEQRAHNGEKDKDTLGFSSSGLHVLLLAGSRL